MGKAARERQKRREAARQGQPQGPELRITDPGSAVQALLEIDSKDEFHRLIETNTYLLSDELLSHLRDFARFDGHTVTAESLLALLEGARTDRDQAWSKFEEQMAGIAELTKESRAQQVEIERAMREGRPDAVAALVDEALPVAREAGLGGAVGLLHRQRASAYLQRPTGDRAENVEEALAGYRAALPLVTSDEERADVLMHAGLAYAERVYGDRARNLEESITCLRGALDALSASSPPELWAVVRTNLANALLQREEGDKAENLREANSLCRQALTYRSPIRNAYDWVYTQITLGAILQDLAALGEADESEAIAAYQAVLAEEKRIERWQMAKAHLNLGRLKRIQGQVTFEERVEAHERDEEIGDRTPVLEEALEHLQTALPIVEGAPDPLLYGQVLNQLAEVLAALEQEQEAIEIGRRALASLGPTSSPRECVSAGWRLGNLLANRGEWSEAAEAFLAATQAAELSFHARLQTHSREADSACAGNLARWTSFALAQAGDPVTATLVLESGRARELRRRLGAEQLDSRRLEELPEGLENDYLVAVGNLRLASLGSAGSVAGQELQEVLERIRMVEGFEDFGTVARREDLAAAVSPGWPVVYINPTPWGTQVIRVVASGEIESIVLAQPTALEVFMRFTLGDAVERPELGEIEPSSYFAAIGAFGNDERDIKRNLEEALPWLGDTVARPLQASLTEVEADGVTLIPCGPIAVAPLHAASWKANGRSKCLLDHLSVRFAPSSVAAATSLRRASALEKHPLTLVALADPTEDLDAAGPEVSLIEAQFDPAQVIIARGQEASSEFLRQHGPEASHLHLACHAQAGVLDSAGAAILLSDGWLPAFELTTVELHSRLAVVSACESALASIHHLPDEGLSIGNLMLAAGSAGAIATLWPVNDLSTALLMNRLYEGILIDGLPPPLALRRAQLWLRDLTPTDEEAYLDDHPELEEAYRLRCQEGREPGRRGSQAISASAGPYAHPDYWAPFIAVGA